MPKKALCLLNITDSQGMEGADHLALALAYQLQQRGHNIDWMCPKTSLSYAKAQRYGFQTQDTTSLMPEQLTNYCLKNHIDMIIPHHSRARRLTLKARDLRQHSKIIFMRHAITRSIPLIGHLLQNFKVDLQIAVSNSVKKSLLYSGTLPNKVQTLLGSIDPYPFQHPDTTQITQLKEKYFSKKTCHLGMIARSTKRLGLHKKGHARLFRALAQVKADYHLHLIGAESMEDCDFFYAAARQYGLDTKNISLHLFTNEITAFYHCLDINILASAREGLGLVILEAMACGVPCIGLRAGGVREIIKDNHNGLLASPYGTHDLSQKIQQLIENPTLRQSLAQQAKQTLQDKFLIANMAENFERLCYQLTTFGRENRL